MIELRQGGGFGRTVQVDTGLTARSWARATASCTAGALIDAIADLLEVDAAALRGGPPAARARARLHGLPPVRLSDPAAIRSRNRPR